MANAANFCSDLDNVKHVDALQRIEEINGFEGEISSILKSVVGLRVI